jgi:uncharacterized YceG family protein/putative transcription antitermination factor YqgF
MRVLALDYGSARCGCALSDPTGTLATPIEAVERPATRKGMARLAALVREREVGRVVVGLPLGLSGEDTAQTGETRAFAARLGEAVGLSIDLFDERRRPAGGLARPPRLRGRAVSGRTPEEREAARLERERRRAARDGRPLPPEAAPPEPPRPEQPLTGERPIDPQATQQFDVSAAWDGELPPRENGTGEHAITDAPPTQQFDATAAWTGEHAAVETAAPTTEAEVPLGTRRVTAHERVAAAMPGGRGGRKQRRPPGPPGTAAGGLRPGGGHRPGRRIGALLAIALVALAGWFLISLYQPFTGDGSGRVVVKVPQGASASRIGDLLAAEGVVGSSFFFDLRAKLSGQRGDLKSGTFTLRHDMSYGAALDALTKNPPAPPVVRITIPEGRSRREIVPLARQAGLRGDYLAASRSSTLLDLRRDGAPKGATLEGFLFPATYELKRGATARQLVAEQVAAFKQSLARVNLRYARSKNLSVFDVVTIAAMVEREVAVAKERPLVAAVIYNRLHQGMPLGIDATLRFALNDWTHPLRVSQLASTTPYNTRNHQGLPPGPIGNPGLASLQAAAHPAKVPYLFYVVKPGTCGEHAFSSTDAQFQRDVAKYNAARNAAGGKSPTKC